MNSATLYRHRWLMIRLPVALVAAALAGLAWIWLYPMPETRLTISSGQPDGAYRLFADRYAQAFARHGIALTIETSDGSQQNLERLRHSPAQADLAFVQGGFGWSSQPGQPERLGGVQTLASVDIEGLWLFSRDSALTSLEGLAGLQVAAGPQGSGHRVLFQRLLSQQRIGLNEVRWSPLSGAAARDALIRHEVDAVFMVASSQAPGVLALLTTPGVHLAMLQRTAALSERNGFLETRLLPQDGLGRNLPAADTPLLTTPTHLLAREDLNPALKRMATAVAMEVHGQAGPFHRAGDFPNLRRSDFPAAAQARQVLGGGLNRLERLLPFWWAQVVQRLLVICVPLLLVAGLLFLFIPALLRVRLESRMTRWYGELRFIEHDLAHHNVDIGGIELSRINARLKKMEAAIAAMPLPKELAQRWHTLLQHVDFVRRRMRSYRGR